MPIKALIAAIERRPNTAFGAFAVLHFGVWSALPALFYLNLPLDLIEALTYGPEWQLGYDKLPPLPWWLVEIAHRLFDSDYFYYALGQLAVLSALWAVFALTRPIAGALGALIAVLIVDGLHYLHYSAAKFNHDVIELPFWALAGLAFHSAMRGRALHHWVLLGLAIGMALWAKYFVIVLVVPLALFVLLDRDARPALRTPGPWVAGAVAFLVTAPHLVWLLANDFLPFAYAQARAAPPRSLFDHIIRPLIFGGSQLLFLMPALVIAAPLLLSRHNTSPSKADCFDRRILRLLAFGPAATALAGSLLTGRTMVAMWGYPLWLFLGSWIVVCIGTPVEIAQTRRIAGLWIATFAGFALAFVVNYSVLPHYDHRYRAVFFPGQRLAAELSERFKAATGQPLAYVVAGTWTGGNVFHYAAEHPHVLIDAKPTRAPWIDLDDLKTKGAVVVWTGGDSTNVATYAVTTPGAQLQAPFTLEDLKGVRVLHFGWAIIRPQPRRTSVERPDDCRNLVEDFADLAFTDD